MSDAALTFRRPDRLVALVTGGGSGAGAAIARAYAAMGVRVVVSDIDYALAGAVAGEIRGAGGQALAHRCDVANEEQVATLITRAMREFGGLHFVVNNAGPYLADDDPLDHWTRMINVNLLGTLLITRHAIEAMKVRGGSIVNIASGSGLGFGAEQQPAYGAAKAGVMRFTAAMGFLQDRHRIRVNCVVPDWIETAQVQGWLRDLSPAQRAAAHVPDVLTTPDEFAAAVLAVSLREDCAGRVLLCRSGQPLVLIRNGDPGYRELETF